MLYVNPLSSPRVYSDAALTQEVRQRRVALQELEQYFGRLLLREMRATVPEDGLFPKTAQERHFEEMLDDALSAEMARSGQLGIARLLEQQLRARDIQKGLAEGEMSAQSEAAAEPDPADGVK